MASKTNRKRRLIQALTINSPKKLLLFFIVAFALSGAGVLVHRSFAGHDRGEDVDFVDRIFYHAGWASRETETANNSKKGAQVWRMFTGGAIRNVFQMKVYHCGVLTTLMSV